MPNYFNPYNTIYPASYQNGYSGYPMMNSGYSAMPQMTPGMSGGQSSTNQYMINVDGETSARAWQPQTSVGPNTIIPLWDLDGVHVYFKSTDAYGRINPLRKGRIVFDDDQQSMLQERNDVSGNNQSQQMDVSQYVTKQDLDELKRELKSMLPQKSQISKQYDQNSNRSDNK